MNYNKHIWQNGEIATADKMNNIENGIDDTQKNIPTKISQLQQDINYVEYHLSQTGVDLNNLKNAGQYALYGNNANSPFTGICVLEVVVYSVDWILQRITDISQSPKCYVRCFYSGTTWGDWKQVF